MFVKFVQTVLTMWTLLFVHTILNIYADTHKQKVDPHYLVIVIVHFSNSGYLRRLGRYIGNGGINIFSLTIHFIPISLSSFLT